MCRVAEYRELRKKLKKAIDSNNLMLDDAVFSDQLDNLWEEMTEEEREKFLQK